MRIAIIGSGGREHAICHKIYQSKKIKKIFCLPGNGGTNEIAENIDINLKNFEEIKKLPGVGIYTANALLALIYNQPRIPFDGNVKRVFSRILNKHEKKLNFENIINKNKKNLFCSKRNSDFVEAMMEFGALICKPQEPNCNICPINTVCKFRKSNKNLKLTDTINLLD